MWMLMKCTPSGWKDYVRWQANDRATPKRVYLVDGEDLAVLQARFPRPSTVGTAASVAQNQVGRTPGVAMSTTAKRS